MEDWKIPPSLLRPQGKTQDSFSGQEKKYLLESVLCLFRRDSRVAYLIVETALGIEISSFNR
jgi:hypothetical protein